MAQLQDRRTLPRQRVLKSAKLVAMNAWVFIDGVVKDQSETGAKIACEQPLLVPDDFRLLILKENTIRPCQVKWRTSTCLGVVYTGELKTAPPRKF